MVPLDVALSPQLIVAAKSATAACAAASSVKLPTTLVNAVVATPARLLLASAVNVPSEIVAWKVASAVCPPSSLAVTVIGCRVVAGMAASYTFDALSSKGPEQSQ